MSAALLINAPRPDSLRFMPALNVTHAEIDQMIGVLDEVLGRVIPSPRSGEGGRREAAAGWGLARVKRPHPPHRLRCATTVRTLPLRGEGCTRSSGGFTWRNM